MKRGLKEILFRIVMFFIALLFTGLWIETGSFDAVLSSFSILWISLNIVEWFSWADSNAHDRTWYHNSGFLTRAIFRKDPNGE